MTNQRPFGLGAIPTFEKDNTHPHIMSILEKSDLPIPAPPKSLKYSQNFGPIKNQGYTGMCVGFATSYKMEADIKEMFGHSVILSALGCYNGAKLLDGNTQEGTYATHCAQWIKENGGALLESDFPLDFSMEAKGIPPTARRTPEYEIDSFGVSYGLDHLRQAMTATGPALISIAVTPTFDSPVDGVIHYDPNQTAVRGWHEICIADYDDDTGLLHFPNSWGDWYGINGWASMTYEYYTHFSADTVSIIPNISNKFVGDENADSYINLLDAYLALKIAARTQSWPDNLSNIADVNKDGKIDIRDVMAIIHKIMGKG